jgi:hypothetical protein
MTLADRLSVEGGQSVVDVQRAEAEEEQLVDSVTAAIANLPSEEYANETEPAQPTSKDVYAKKEAPFDLMAPDNPDLSEIK